jgi:periplasmic protein TonB
MQTRHTSTLLSLAIHLGVVALLFTVTVDPVGRKLIGQGFDRATRLIAPYMPDVKAPHGDRSHGGGGGGKHDVLPAGRGALPKLSPRPFTPPAAVIRNPEPKLIMEPSIMVAPDAPVPRLNMTQLGDPLTLPGPPSDGTGSGGGIGNTKGRGVGGGDGDGYGPGHDGNTGGGVNNFKGGAGSRGVTIPAALLWKIEPEYSDEARRARLQGTVVLYLEVDSEGKPRNIRVHQGLGLGLDDKAIDAVLRWKFRAGRRDGRPVTTSALVEVNFRLL